MTLTLDLSQELELKLRREAAQQGVTLSDYVLQVLSGGGTSGHRFSGSELVAYWQREGLIGNRNDIQDSQAHARKLRAEAEHRNR
jgi:hypothetical protein